MILRVNRFFSSGHDAFGTDPSSSNDADSSGSASPHTPFTKEAIRQNLASQGHRDDTISEVFELLHDRIPSFIEEIEKAQRSADLSSVTSQAHAAKGVLNTIQLHEVAEIARQLESAARSEDSDEVSRKGNELLNALRRLNESLNDD